MLSIGYETPLDMTRLNDLLKLVASEGENAAWNEVVPALKASVAQARASCHTALLVTRRALEAKALNKEHPWFEKKVEFQPQPSYKIVIEAGQAVFRATWEYTINP